MTVYVDDWRQRAKVGSINAKWSHLVAGDQDELHAFATRLGLHRSWYQGGRRPHYDVTDSMRTRAIALGAVAISWRDLPRLRREGAIQ
ncbi:hypothetical protein GCM10010156_76560 [Planobispora rosea]|uniref:DUF4031 domain-containing protein n=1 Tax=Planobispora rosea TaxID=35762 RepID=A0A8J3WGB5_PLARO|nr:DUF4031 domain-containing protein [Planobispora rosea]GGT08169.1 hypothetical protein GCM10010156_76560 [Planobispora rosea]GIH89134.1 hypothetical protein Pro02_75420 [Planobispora rosea]